MTSRRANIICDKYFEPPKKIVTDKKRRTVGANDYIHLSHRSSGTSKGQSSKGDPLSENHGRYSFKFPNIFESIGKAVGVNPTI